MPRTEYHGKRGANAGDEYHELWALRRALELIVPGTPLCILTVEGVLASDEQGVSEAVWDGVDAACYFGSDIDRIDAVELVQLKYSGSASTSSWTVARLAYADNKKKTNALINRLAMAWKTMRERRPELNEANAITVKLVSNQKISSQVFKAIKADSSDPSRKKLQQASGLRSSEFSEFISTLDFSECGSTSRFALEERAIETLSQFKDGDVRTELFQLREFIRKRMRPEGQGQLITAESIFGLFGHAERRAFFPCPSRIHEVDPLIPRSVCNQLCDLFLCGTQKICLHGAGGEGKTTVLQDLATRLPVGSELIVYDCYGEGTYLDTNAFRHRSVDAFLQLGNECGTRMLLPPLFAEHGVDYPRRFAAKLAVAAQVLAERSSEALLVVAVDAADNAVTAAAQCVPPEQSFVREFVRLGDLPANVRLLLSARTGRLDTLDLPNDVSLVPLSAFNEDESKSFAESRLGALPDDWHAEFHKLSGGNPRVQAYAIDFAREVPEQALEYLNPNGKDLSSIFTAHMEEARLRSGSSSDLDNLSAALTLLPRPIPLAHLAGVSGFSSAHARDLVLDLAPGLTLRDQKVSFADEDFENFVRSKGVAVSATVTRRAADRLMDFRLKDEYSATNVAGLALLAERRDVVLALVREDSHDYPIDDPALRGEVKRRRLRAAMHVCREAGNPVDAAAILLEGAHAIKTDEAVQRTLTNELELAAHFSRDHIVALVLRERDRRSTHGTLLMHLVGIDGVAADRVGVRASYRAFLAWNDERQAVIRDEDENNRRRRTNTSWELGADDLAAMIVGLIHTDGVIEGVRFLARPKPARFRFEVLVCFVRRMVRRGDFELLRSLADILPRRHVGRPMIEMALGLSGEPVDVNAILIAVERDVAFGGFEAHGGKSKYSDGGRDDERVQFLLDCCDLVAIHKVDNARLNAVLDEVISPATRTLEEINRYSPRRCDALMRAFALSCVLRGDAVTIERFIVESPSSRALASKRRRDNEKKHDLEKAKELFEPILALHELRARVLIGEIEAPDASGPIGKAISSLCTAERYRHREYEYRPHDDVAIQAVVTLSAVPKMDNSKLSEEIVESLGPVEALMRTGARDLLERVSIVPDFRDAIIAISVKCCDSIREQKIAAEEKIEYLVQLAKLLLPLDREAAGYCFNAAIGIAGQVDVDTLHAITITTSMANRARIASDSAQRNMFACDFAAVIQDAAVRLGDSDHFPWDEVATALAILSPPAALATSARFTELNLLRSNSFLAKLLEQAFIDGSLDDSVLAAFLPILGLWGDKLAACLVERGVANEDAELVEICACQAMREQFGNLDHLALLAASLSKPKLWTKALIETASFLGTEPELERSTKRAEPTMQSETAPPAKREESTSRSFAEIDGVTSFLAEVDGIVATKKEEYVSRREVADELLRQVPNYRIETFLDILCDIPSDDNIVRDITGLLYGVLKRWRENYSSQQWARNRLLNIIEKRLPDFVRYIQFQSIDFLELLRQTGQTDDVVATRVLAAIEHHIESLSSHEVFRLVGLLAEFLQPHEALGVLERHIGVMLRNVPPGDRQVLGFDRLPVEVDNATARYFFAELGNASHPRRWRAAHGLRALARLGQIRLLEIMRDDYERISEPCFGHPVVPFYFLAARLWFVISIARIAWEAPLAVMNFADWLLLQGERSDFPHLLIRSAARDALEGLVAAGGINAATAARAATINQSLLAPVAPKKKSWDVGFDRYHPPNDEGRRFRFDALDTLPYWYTPFLRCFADPAPSEFLDRAEHWIVDCWGATEDAWEYDKLRGNSYFTRNGVDRSYGGHGALPAIERYRTYLEWHAMFVAGGEVLAEWPLQIFDDDDSWNSLPAWLARQGPTLAPNWLSDLRGAKPLDPHYWWPPSEKRWLQSPKLADLRLALRLDDPDWLVLSSYRSIRHNEMVGSERIESALVSREHATALRLALEASESSHLYRLAVNEALEDENVPKQFVLKPLLADHHGDTELDIYDELRGDVTAPSCVLHHNVLQQLKLVRDPSRLPIWRDTDGNVAVFTRAWSDPDRYQRERRREFVSGEELLIRRDVLRSLLKTEGLDLITNLTFTRRIGEPSYAPKAKVKEREYDHVIIFQVEGSIEARQGNLGRWA